MAFFSAHFFSPSLFSFFSHKSLIKRSFVQYSKISQSGLFAFYWCSTIYAISTSCRNCLNLISLNICCFWHFYPKGIFVSNENFSNHFFGKRTSLDDVWFANKSCSLPVYQIYWDSNTKISRILKFKYDRCIEWFQVFVSFFGIPIISSNQEIY